MLSPTVRQGRCWNILIEDKFLFFCSVRNFLISINVLVGTLDITFTSNLHLFLTFFFFFMLIIHLLLIFIESNKLPSHTSICHAYLDCSHKVEKLSPIYFLHVFSGLTSSFFSVGDQISSRNCGQGFSNAFYNGTNISSFTVLLETSLLKHHRVTNVTLATLPGWQSYSWVQNCIVFLCCSYTKSSQLNVVIAG